MALDEVKVSKSPLVWPLPLEEEKPQFTAHAHEHSTPEHHWHGESTCDQFCRRGQRLHRHRVAKSLGAILAEQVQPIDSNMYVPRGTPPPDDYRVVDAQLRQSETPE